MVRHLLLGLFILTVAVVVIGGLNHDPGLKEPHHRVARQAGTTRRPTTRKQTTRKPGAVATTKRNSGTTKKSANMVKTTTRRITTGKKTATTKKGMATTRKMTTKKTGTTKKKGTTKKGTTKKGVATTRKPTSTTKHKYYNPDNQAREPPPYSDYDDDSDLPDDLYTVDEDQSEEGAVTELDSYENPDTALVSSTEATIPQKRATTTTRNPRKRRWNFFNSWWSNRNYWRRW